jgi:hypothetical protein
MSLQNPMDLSGPPTNYQQPNTAAPAPQANVADYPVGADVLNITWPVAVYQQPGAGARDPYPVVSGLTGPMGTSKNPT